MWLSLPITIGSSMERASIPMLSGLQQEVLEKKIKKASVKKIKEGQENFELDTLKTELDEVLETLEDPPEDEMLDDLVLIQYAIF